MSEFPDNPTSDGPPDGPGSTPGSYPNPEWDSASAPPPSEHAAYLPPDPGAPPPGEVSPGGMPLDPRAIPPRVHPPGAVPSPAHYATAPYAMQYAPRPRPPRVWTVFVALIVMIIAQAVLGGIIVAGYLVVTGGLSSADDPFAMMEHLMSETGALLSVIIGAEGAILLVTVVCALLSPVRFPRRLGLGKSSLPLYLWPLPMISVFATALMGMSCVWGLISWTGLFTPEDMLASLGDPDDVVLVAIMLGVLPGVCEELFFRGYMQQRLLARWHPVLAVGVTSVCFAVFHLNPLQVVGVFFSGIWLSVLAWRTGSIWLSVATHICLNTTVILASEPMLVMIQNDQTTPLFAAAGLAFTALAISIVLLIRYKPPPQPPDQPPAGPSQIPTPPPRPAPPASSRSVFDHERSASHQPKLDPPAEV